MDYEESQLIEQTRLCQLDELASDRYKIQGGRRPLLASTDSFIRSLAF